MASDRVYPAVRITEEKMTHQQILDSFNTAFAFEYTLKVTKSKNTRIIHFDAKKLNELTEDDLVLEEFDKFYEDLDRYGKLWIEANPQYTNETEGFLYITEPEEGFWEVTYAKAKPKPVKPAAKPKSKAKAKTAVVFCTCGGCTCGKPLGTAI